MKKILGLTLLFITILGVTSCANNTEIVSLDEIKSNYYTDDEIERILWHVNRDDLIKVWGTPDRTITYENEDVWILNERQVLVISYNRNNKLNDVDIED